MRNTSVRLLLLVLFLCFSLIVSCGGGGSPTPVPDPVPQPGGGEGTQEDPITLTVGQSRSGSIGALGDSYYKFTVTTAGIHTISLTNATHDLRWDLYNNASYTSLLSQCDSRSAGGDEDCATTALVVDGTYYLHVRNKDAASGTYLVAVNGPVAPSAPTGVTATPGSANVRIAWSEVVNAASYRLYWSTTEGSGTSGTLIGNITGTSYLHAGLTPGTTYYYVVTAVNAIGVSAPSSQASAVPLAAGTPLLSTNFDDGTLQGWTATGAWGVATSSKYSGSHSVSDSPSGNYADSSNTWIISPVLDLTGTTNPALNFYHHYDIETNADYGYVEISTDNGSTWKFLKVYTGIQSAPFVFVSIDLTPYMTSSQVRIRFRLVSDFGIARDGWYIDDIVVSP